jgi:CubicO group peptidase (beta-lactamase class C family)
VSQSHDPSTLQGRASLALSDGNLADHWETFNTSALLAPEMAGVNGTATAAALAGMYNALASGGESGAVRLVSRASIETFRTLQIQGPNALELEPDPDPATVELHQRMLGYHGSSRPPGGSGRLGPSATAFGHDGAGGQIAFADPEHAIAAGFVRSQMTMEPGYSAVLLERLYACAEVA